MAISQVINSSSKVKNSKESAFVKFIKTDARAKSDFKS